MSTPALSKRGVSTPFRFDELLKPWNEWFDNGGLAGRTMNVPAVNITEDANGYQVALAVPGMKKADFKIGLEGDMLTISSEKEEKDVKFTRNEYNYSSFSRSFTVPAEIDREKIEASYEDGVLKIVLPHKAELKKLTATTIDVK